MKRYYVFKNEPHATMQVYFAENKREALKKFSKDMGKDYIFVNKDKAYMSTHNLVEDQDYFHYNFSKWSYIAEK